MLTIEYAKNPAYSDADGQTIDLIVKFYEMASEMSFGATPFDPMSYGVELYNNAVAGLYGSISPYVPPLESEQPVTSGTQTL
jgi:hypothetical protein